MAHPAVYWHGLFGSQYWIARFVFQRGLALIYFIAFLNAFNEFPALLGERGLLPVPEYLRRVSFKTAPSIFHFFYSDRFLRAVSGIGMLLAIAALSSFSERGPLWVSAVVWALLYVLYLSIMNVGQTFYGFGWESMLLEAGFLAIFLGSNETAVPILIIFLLRWMLFRLEFGAGLIKLRGDPCWRNLTCLEYHHQTQPLPNPLSSYFHHLPRSLHKLEVVGNFVAQLVLPWGLFFPQPVAAIAGVLMFVTQMWLFISGNYSWLNALTILLTIPAFTNAQLGAILHLKAPSSLAAPAGDDWVIVAVTIGVVILSYWPARNLISRRQFMNFSFNPYHLLNTYGAFGTVTKTRFEIVIECTDDSTISSQTRWREYEFKAKPGDPHRRPPQIAPYHLRLDWLMWFAAMSPAYDYLEHPWFLALMQKLLQNDRPVLKLLRSAPFPHAPRYVRARWYRYRFATAKERRETRQWWIRSLVGEYLPLVRIGSGERDSSEEHGTVW
jgi:hypothetical protein